MAMIKGYELKIPPLKGSLQRRSIRFRNNIINTLRKIGVPEDDIEVPMERMAMKKAQASVSWYFDKSNLFCSYEGGNFAENLYIISKVIEVAVQELLDEIITVNEFVNKFEEEEDIEELRKKARETLGVPEDCLDLSLINKKYKDLAKQLHPDMDGGDAKRFKEINHAHKILKRELG